MTGQCIGPWQPQWAETPWPARSGRGDSWGDGEKRSPNVSFFFCCGHFAATISQPSVDARKNPPRQRRTVTPWFLRKKKHPVLSGQPHPGAASVPLPRPACAPAAFIAPKFHVSPPHACPALLHEKVSVAYGSGIIVYCTQAVNAAHILAFRCNLVLQKENGTATSQQLFLVTATTSTAHFCRGLFYISRQPQPTRFFPQIYNYPPHPPHPKHNPSFYPRHFFNLTFDFPQCSHIL